MTETQTIKSRLLLFIKSLGIGQGKFEKACGLSNGWVNNIKGNIKEDKLQKITLQYPELNPGWLMTGEGSMLRTVLSDKDPLKQTTELTEAEKRIQELQERVKALEQSNQTKDSTIKVLTKALETAQKLADMAKQN